MVRLGNDLSLNFPGVHTTLVGADSLDILCQNISIATKGLSEEEKEFRNQLMTTYGHKVIPHEINELCYEKLKTST